MNNTNSEVISRKRIFIFLIIFIFLFLIIITRIGYLQLYNTKASVKKLEEMSTKIVYGRQKPRGKIYDRNFNVIVDNVGTYEISYKKENGTTVKDEINLAYTLAEKLDVNYSKLLDRNLREFWVVNNKELANEKITKEEYELYERRKLKASELENLKIKRITKEELEKFNDLDRKAAYIYYLMHNGYSYDEKIIKEEATDEEYSYITQNISKLKGINAYSSWQRTYPYKDTLRQILGNVSTSNQGIPEELKSYYLNKGYLLNDRVGLSYLEKEYEEHLRGTKDVYKLKNGVKTLVKEGKKGNDIVLSIDINLQLELEKIIKEELIKAKGEANTSFFDHSSVIITNPKTGEVLAMASKQIKNTLDGYKITDYTTNILTGSDTPGSIVKGASMLVGYSTGNLKIGDVLYDKCIKFKNTPQKCSWKTSLGSLNDIKALQLSSNSYQFQLALKVAGIKYYYDMPIKVDDTALNTYRNIFNKLGLGVKSGIDLPNETIGYKGKQSNAGLLLNYAIGQYDTFTVLQLSSYINTIANEGTRVKLNLVNEIRYPSTNSEIGKIKEKYEVKILEEVDIDKSYFKRVKEGFQSVMIGSLGRGYMGNISNPAGKTGTSETFFDSDNDKIVDMETYTKSFVGYAPYDNPVMSIVSISPHISYKNDKNSYTSSINKRITSRICNIFFEIYK